MTQQSYKTNSVIPIRTQGPTIETEKGVNKFKSVLNHYKTTSMGKPPWDFL